MIPLHLCFSGKGVVLRLRDNCKTLVFSIDPALDRGPLFPLRQVDPQHATRHTTAPKHFELAKTTKDTKVTSKESSTKGPKSPSLKRNVRSAKSSK